MPSENGSYTVDGNLITATYSNTQSSTIAYNVVATPASGYKFFGWYNETTGTIINRNASAALNIEQNCTITAKFVESDLALFETAGVTFADLGEAVSYAQEKKTTKITLAESGSIKGQYTIPTGITLLIPFDAAGTVYTSSPASSGTTAAARSAYRTMTMVSGSSITVDGAISVGAKHNAGAGSGQMSVSGPYGYIKMSDGSKIEVNDKGSLYAWGYISGNGHVTAKSGATVYEYFQIVDFRGGTQTSNMQNGSVFPLSQYYIQNVEVPMTLEAGATEKVYASLYAGGMTVSTSVDFIGSSGLFNIKSGSFTKTYIPSKDRMDYTVEGEMELNNLQLKVATVSVNSKNYVLPINSNITLNINSGSKVTVKQDIYLAPGVEVNIAQNADLTIATGYSAYVYDKDQWGNYTMSAQFIPVSYSPTRSYNRSSKDIVDAKINVNGTLTANGYLYTTESGANICSDGNGQYLMNAGAGTKTTTQQCVNNSSTVDINITSAKLHNAAQYTGTDEEYTLTSEAVEGDVFAYSASSGKWAKAGAEECTHENTIVKDAKEATCTEDGYTGDTYCADCDEKIAEGEIIEALGHDYVETVMKEATCTEAGEKQLKCSRCDDTKTEEIPAKGHTEVTDEAVPATCTESGLTEGSHCSVCGEVIKAQEATDALGHAWGEGVVSTAPTCNEEGTKTYTCSRCDETKTEAISASGHTVVIDAAVAPTCTETGLKEGSHCSVCGAVIVEQEVIDALGHNYDEGVVTKEPTCTEAGVRTFTCSRCNDSYTNEIAATGHTLVVDDAKEATCTESGLTEGKHCSVCDEVIEAQEVIAATGHAEVIDEAVEATCTESGLTEGKHCSVCDEVLVKQEEIKALGHTEVVDKAIAATCTSGGKTEGKHCSVCGEILVEQENTPALEHEYKDHVCVHCGDVQLHGWVQEEKGTTYYVDGEKAYFESWATIDEKEYFFDPEGYIVKGLCTITDKEGITATYVFDEESGAFAKDMNGVYTFDGNLYLVTNGIAVEIEAGWNVIDGKHYYIDSETKEFVKDGIYWLPYPEGYGPDQWNVENNDEYESLGYDKNSYFIFDEEGVFQNGIDGMYNVDTDTKVVGGNAAPSGSFIAWANHGELPYHPGLVLSDGYYYYFTTGSFEQGKGYVYGKDYTVSKTNDLAYPAEFGEGSFVVGKYTFDEAGHLLVADGFVDSGEDTYYYVKGVKTYAGLIQVEEDYYYINSSCKVVKNRDYTVSKTNGLLPAGTYSFDEEGKMIREDATQNGIVKETDTTWYYYVNGVKTYAGLIQIDGDYYYVNSSFLVIHGRSYFVSKTNGLMPNGTYEFDADGKMVLGKEELNGIVKETDATWYYYVNGVKTYAGLIQIDGDYYYVNSSFQVIHGRSYYVSKTNGLLAAGTYEFDETGKMVVAAEKLNGIVKESDDVWYYYVDGVKTYAGLIQIDGDYYY